MRSSEQELETELDPARIGCAGDAAERRAVHVRYGFEELRFVQNVERFGTKLKRESLCQL